MKSILRNLFLFAVLIGCFAISDISLAQVVTTVVGSNSPGFYGDGGNATSALLNYPAGVACDKLGNVYIADKYNYRVRKVSPSGIISTVAGNGRVGYAGDGGPATAARLNEPTEVAADTSGNIYIVDSRNFVVRKVSPSGVISTFAGNRISGWSGDGGAATAASLTGYNRLVAFADNLYISDRLANKIRVVASSGIITTWAGTGSTCCAGDGTPATAAGFRPGGMVFDAHGNMFVADEVAGRVRRISTSGIITTVAGGGTGGDGSSATAASLAGPISVAFDRYNNLYITERNSNKVRKVNTSGIISTFIGAAGWGSPETGYDTGDGHAASAAIIRNPYCIASDTAGNLYLTDGLSSRVRKIDTSGIINSFAGVWHHYYGEGIPATNAQLLAPGGTFVDNAGNIYISDAHRIRKVNIAGIITTIAGTGAVGYSADGSVASSSPLYNGGSAIRVTTGGEIVFWENGRWLRKITTSGLLATVAGTGASGFSADGTLATSAALGNNGWGVAIDKYNSVYFIDNKRIRKIDASGRLRTVAGNGTWGYTGDGGPATNAQINPVSLCIDTSGNLYFTFSGGIRKVSTSGVITTIAGPGTTGNLGDGGPATAAWFNGLLDIEIDRGGNLFVLDQLNFRIRRISSSGTITTIAGHGLNGTDTSGFAGDGGPSTAALYNSIRDISIDSAGNVYVADFMNNRIRRITYCPPPIVGVIAGSSAVCVGSTITLSDTTAGGVWSIGSTSIASVSASGVVSGITPGTSAISYTVTNSCGTVPAIMTVTVNPGPSAGTITGPDSVCVGSAITLGVSGSSGTTSTWTMTNTSATISGTVVTGSFAGTDTAIHTSANSCGTVSATKIITVMPLPDPGTITGADSVCAGSTITLTESVTGGTWSITGTSATVAGGVVTGVSAGTSSITYSVTNYCGTGIRVHPVLTNPLPVAGSLSGTIAICVGGTTTITPSVTGGTWTSSITTTATVDATGLVTGVAAGVVTISYTITNSCGSDVATTSVTINPPPVAGSISGLDSVCVGDTIVLIDGVTGGAWSSSNTSIATVSGSGGVMGIASGSATITYNVTNTCGSASATHNVYVKSIADCNTGVGSQQLIAGSPGAYPNPNNGSFVVDIPTNSTNVTIIVTDVSGKVISRIQPKNASGLQVPVELGDVARGTYLLNISIDGKSYHDKLIVW